MTDYPVVKGVCEGVVSSVVSGMVARDEGTVFDFTGGTIPSNFTYTRNDTVATYFDAGNKLRIAAANTARPFNLNGSIVGVWAEITRVNRCTNFNAAPAATTNMSVTGTATLSLNSDSAAVIAAGLENVVTGAVFEASGGAAGGTVVIAGGTGATGAFSVSMYARVTAGTSASFGITPNPTAVTVSGSDYQRFIGDNLTATNSADTFVITLPASTTIRFCLNQLEAGSNATSVIIVAGATATRQNEIIVDTSLASRDWFNLAQGSVVAEYIYTNILTNPANSPFFIGSGTDVNLDNCIGMSTIAATTRRKTIARYFVGSVNQYSPDIGSIDAKEQRYYSSISWVNGSHATASTGAGIYQSNTSTTFAVGTITALNRLYVGGRSTTEYINGGICRIIVYKRYHTPSRMGLDMVASGTYTVPCVGQSNMTNWFAAQSGANNTGEISAKSIVDPVLTSSSRNWFVNAGTAGTSLLKYGSSTPTGWWYDLDTGEYGVPLIRCINILRGAVKSNAIISICTNGESDAGNCTIAEFKQGMNMLLNILRSETGNPNLKIVIVPIGRNTAALNGYQTIKEAQWELYDEQPDDFYRAPERAQLALSDSIHMTDAATGICATNTSRKLLNVLGEAVTGVDGPRITNVSRSGTTVTVTIAHDAGTDFTPAAAISGFSYFNGSDYTAAANVITAAVRTDATTITLTLTSDSAGTLYYGLGSWSTYTVANLVLDNSAYTLPLEASKWTVA